jgi:FdhE protein
VKSHVAVKTDLSDSLISERLRNGVPLLSFKDFSPNWDEVGQVFQQIVVWSNRSSEYPPPESESLRNIACNTLFLKKAAEVWYNKNSQIAKAIAINIDDRLFESVIGATLKPFLSAYSDLLLTKVNQELWRRKYCPICGSKPDFAYLDKDKGARWMLCSHCDAEWLFLRLTCPYCGTQNQDALAHFTYEKEPHLYRLYICEECKTYIKTIDLRYTDSEVLLPLERIMTLDMDRQGQGKGYKAGYLH